MSTRRRKNRGVFFDHVLVLLLLTIMTLIVFRKIIALGPSKWIIGDHGDPWQCMWNFWWIKKALLSGKNVFYTDYLFYPVGVKLYFHTLNLSVGVILLPLLVLLNDLKLVYNIFVMSTFVISGYSMYLFLKYFLNKYFKPKRVRGAEKVNAKKLIFIMSFLGAIIYTFSPYHASKALGYYDLLNMQWLPLSMLSIMKALDEPKKKHLIMVSLLILASFFSNFYSFYYTFIFLGFFVLYRYMKKDLDLKNFTHLCVYIFLAMAILAASYLNGIGNYKESKNNYVRDYFQTITVHNYLIPPQFVLMRRIVPLQMTEYYYASEYFMFADSMTYLGTFIVGIPVFLIIYGLIKRRYDNVTLLFIVSLFLYSVMMTLGTSNPLSHLLNELHRACLPYFDLIAVPSRHGLMTMFSFAILFSYASLSVLHYEKKVVFNKFLILVVVMFFIEVFPINYRHYYTFEIPEMIYEMREDPDDYTVLNIPKRNGQGMFMQTIHEKKALEGQTSRIPEESEEVMNALNFAVLEGDMERAKEILRENKVRYVIVNKMYLPVDQYFLYPLVSDLELVIESPHVDIFELI